MLLTYKLKHGRDFSSELKKAFGVAEFAVKNPKCRSSKQVSDYGLPSAISNQILKKYGNQKTIKAVHDPDAKPDKKPEWCEGHVCIACLRDKGVSCPHFAYSEAQKKINKKFRKMIRKHYGLVKKHG